MRIFEQLRVTSLGAIVAAAFLTSHAAAQTQLEREVQSNYPMLERQYGEDVLKSAIATVPAIRREFGNHVAVDLMSLDDYRKIQERALIVDHGFEVLPVRVEGSPLAKWKIDQINDLIRLVQMRHGEPVETGKIPINYPVDVPIATTPGNRVDASLNLVTAIHSGQDGRIECSGIQVGPTTILTAAHCACSGKPLSAGLGDVLDSAMKQRSVRIREWTVFGGNQRCRACANGICNDGFFVEPDIALAQLSAPLSGDYGSLRLARRVLLKASRVVYWAGWGQTNQSEVNENRLKLGATEHVVSPDCASETLPESPCLANVEAFTFSPAIGQGPCRGDSGGGAFVIMTDGSPALALIASRQADPPGETGPGCGNGGIATVLDTPEVLDFLARQGVSIALAADDTVPFLARVTVEE